MKQVLKIGLWVSLFALLAACSKGGVSGKLVSLGGAPTDNPATVAHIREGNMSIRGMDKYRLKAKEQTIPFADIYFAVTPGKHEIMLMNIQDGHVLPYEDIRCYLIKADFLANVSYRVDEDKENKKAVLKRLDNGQIISSADLYDTQTAVLGQPCQWK